MGSFAATCDEVQNASPRTNNLLIGKKSSAMARHNPVLLRYGELRTNGLKRGLEEPGPGPSSIRESQPVQDNYSPGREAASFNGARKALADGPENATSSHEWATTVRRGPASTCLRRVRRADCAVDLVARSDALDDTRLPRLESADQPQEHTRPPVTRPSQAGSETCFGRKTLRGVYPSRRSPHEL